MRITKLCILYLFIALLVAGCTAREPAGTPTPNPTILAISQMLTATGAVPTSTRTLLPTPSRAVTPSATVYIPPAGSRERPAPVGSPFLFDGDNGRLTIVSMETLDALQAQEAPEGQVFLDLDVVIENSGSAPVTYNRLDFRLLQDGEKEIEIFPAQAAAGPLLLGGVLQPEEFVRGHIAFLVTGPVENVLLHFVPSNTAGSFWLAGTTDEPLLAAPPPAEPWPPAGLPGMGQRVEQEGIALTVLGVSGVSRLALGKPQEGIRFLQLDVKIQNTARVSTPFNPLYFRMKDAAGFEYSPILGAPEESLQPGSLAEGRSVQGAVYFAVPETLREALLTYQPGVLFEEYPQIRIGLEIPTAQR